MSVRVDTLIASSLTSIRRVATVRFHLRAENPGAGVVMRLLRLSHPPWADHAWCAWIDDVSVSLRGRDEKGNTLLSE
jgi:hypothetical protein